MRSARNKKKVYLLNKKKLVFIYERFFHAHIQTETRLIYLTCIIKIRIVDDKFSRMQQPVHVSFLVLVYPDGGSLYHNVHRGSLDIWQ